MKRILGLLALAAALAVVGCDTETDSERAYREGVEARNAAIAAGATQPESEPLVAVPETQDEAMLLVGQWLVREKLKDPGSAEFRRMFVSGSVICGEVNAKNAYGAYMGFERFIAASTEATFIESGVAPGAMDEAWEQYCQA